MISETLARYILSVVTLLTLTLLHTEVQARTPGGAIPDNVELLFETSEGTFTAELYRDKAPLTVANFLTYVDEGYYAHTLFHRVIPGFVVQGGGFQQGLGPKGKTHAPVRSESGNRLKNARGTLSMARRTHPDTATSQFFINLGDNPRLDYRTQHQPGYTVFGKVTAGMDVVDRIAALPTHSVGRMSDVPQQDVLLISVRRKTPATAPAETPAATPGTTQQFVAGEDYVVLDRPVPTRNPDRIEVVEMFSYGCPHCYELDPVIRDWSRDQADDVDFWLFPAVWNEAMKLYARAFYTAETLGVTDAVHAPLFTAIVPQQQSIRNETDLAALFAKHGIDKTAFTEAFNAPQVIAAVGHAEERVRLYRPVGAPEIVVNGKYRVDRMHAGGLIEMLAVTEFLIDKERAARMAQTAAGP